MDFIKIIEKFKESSILDDKKILKIGNKKSCCVLGNSGSVISSEKGNEIDSLDFIIRNNFGISRGYEKYIGSRTDLRIVNMHGFLYLHDMEHRERVKIKFPEEDFEFLWKVKDEIIVDRHDQGILKGREIFDNNGNILIKMSNEFKEWEKYNNMNLTTGLVSILISCCLFEEVWTYGFDFYSSNYPDHYFEKSLSYNRDSHNLSEEINIFKKLLEKNIIKKM